MKDDNRTDHLPKTAGGRIISNVPLAHPDNTPADIINNIQRQAIGFETIHYVYIVDGNRHLVGAISLKEIFDADPSSLLKDIMITDLISVTPDTDQEKVALLALRNNLKSIPVVADNGLFLGIVTADTIFSILHSEAIEDILLTAGVQNFDDPAKSIIKAPALTHIKKRLPWLVLGLGGGIMAAMVVDGFEEVLQAHLLLAAFIPTIVYMADAVGTQTETIFIRSLSLDKSINIASYIWRESKIGLALSFCLGLLTALISYAIWQSPSLSLIFGLSLLATIFTAMIVAIAMPLMLHKTKADPAVASGPFATVIRDLLSIFIYFGIAHVMLRFFIL